MPNKPVPMHDPSDAEVRLGVEKVLPGSADGLSPEDGLRLMQDRIVELKQNIVGWNRILDTDSHNETARKCLAADQTDLRIAEARLTEYQLQIGSRN